MREMLTLAKRKKYIVHTNIRTPSISPFKVAIWASSRLLDSFPYRDHKSLAFSSKSLRSSADSSGDGFGSFRLFMPSRPHHQIIKCPTQLIRDTYRHQYVHS